jgi:DNA-binding transcriptional MerR regulator
MRIGELGAAVGLPTRTIRFYEQAGLLEEPPRTAAGYRDYPPGAAARLAFIRHAQGAGFTLGEIRGILHVRDRGQPPCSHVTQLISQHLAQVDQRITELTRTRAALANLQLRAAATDPGSCAELEICSILGDP